MPKQVMAAGSTISAPDYGEWGSPGLNTVATPARSFGMVVGAPGVGKSTLYRGFAGALLINADCHSCPKASKDSPDPLCRFFPVKDAAGRIVNQLGQPILTLEWDHFHTIFTKLFAAAKADKPRPTTIVMDTVSMMVPLYRAWIAKTHPSLSKWGGKIDDIPDGKPSLKCWGLVYDGLTKLFMDLMFAGYGVHLLAHLVETFYETTDKAGNPITGSRISHNIPDRLYDRYSSALEFYVGIERVSKPVPVRDKSGKAIGIKVDTKHYLVNKGANLGDNTRSRLNLPDRILLPDPETAFECFTQAYKDAS